MQHELELIKAIQKGNKEAFRQIVKKYEALVLAICYKIIRNNEEAENVAQETFLQVYKSIKTYDTRNFKLWIGKIATNKSIDWKRKHKLEYLNCVELDENIIFDRKNLLDMEDNLIKKENFAKVRKILDELPEKYRRIIKKFYFQDKSYKDISIEENISVKTVESILYRGKKSIKRLWKGEEA